MRLPVVLAVLLWASTGSAAFGQDYGRYVGDVVAKWSRDGRTMELVQPFVYEDPRGGRWDAPAGSVIDGASIPQFAWSFIGGPFEGRYRNASVIHDVACVRRSRDWTQVHETFYTAMRLSGVDALMAKIMYAAVYHFGPRWPLVTAVTRYSVESTRPETICINAAFGKKACVEGPAITFAGEVGKLKTTRIEVPPPPRSITPESFKRLSEEIRAGEGTSSGGLTLEQIREFKQ